jgi:hypothetical protein
VLSQTRSSCCIPGDAPCFAFPSLVPKLAIHGEASIVSIVMVKPTRKPDTSEPLTSSKRIDLSLGPSDRATTTEDGESQMISQKANDRKDTSYDEGPRDPNNPDDLDDGNSAGGAGSPSGGGKGGCCWPSQRNAEMRRPGHMCGFSGQVSSQSQMASTFSWPTDHHTCIATSAEQGMQSAIC